ncbi:MAG: glycosyltransferase [Phycisphaeraceae bacterium]|nr:MAG: glycosyltransferase [Phycisphaeraceae bacterium]
MAHLDFDEELVVCLVDDFDAVRAGAAAQCDGDEEGGGEGGGDGDGRLTPALRAMECAMRWCVMLLQVYKIAAREFNLMSSCLRLPPIVARCTLTVLSEAGGACRDRAQGRSVPMSSRSARILVCTPFEDPSWRWLADKPELSGHQWTFMNGDLFRRRAHGWVAHGLRCALWTRRFDLVITHAPYMTLYVASAMRLLRRHTPHLAFSFNHGNLRFFTGARLWMARRSLPSVAGFCVYSAAERRLLAQRYGLPVERMSFQHWAVGMPKYPQGPAPRWLEELKPYVCCVGRNNRDFATPAAAVCGLPVNLLVVCVKGQFTPEAGVENVKVLEDQPLELCNQIMAHSMASLVPLLSDETGAGHITIVTAMQLGRPQIVTGVETIKDYVFDGIHGIAVPGKDAGAMRDAILRLLKSPDERERMGENARAFANEWLDEQAAARSVAHVIDTFLDRGKTPTAPPGWSEYRKALLTGSVAGISDGPWVASARGASPEY